jgi:hypothetical protein
MAYHDDLLQQAIDLAHKNPTAAKQADLRRSVSTAYYALFHMLISETVAHWSLASSRDALGRMFEHSLMKKATNKLSNPQLFPFAGENPTVVQDLRKVARDFVQLQDKRLIADYDNTTLLDSNRSPQRSDHSRESIFYLEVNQK